MRKYIISDTSSNNDIYKIIEMIWQIISIKLTSYGNFVMSSGGD